MNAPETPRGIRARRLKTEPWEPFFDGLRKVLPRPSDLAFFNWETMTSTSNSSPNFQVSMTGDGGGA